jgi:hypothetical protein
MESNTTDYYLNFTSNKSEINFDEVFKNRPLKMVLICFACVSIPIIFLLCYGIIWFERFGSGNKHLVFYFCCSVFYLHLLVLFLSKKILQNNKLGISYLYLTLHTLAKPILN